MYTGHGVDPDTCTNDEITVLSSESVNASSPPESTAGIASGSVTRRNTTAGGANRSAAASSSRSSRPANRARTMNVTTAVANSELPITRRTMPLLKIPRCRSCPSVTSHGSSDTASTISGVTVTRPRPSTSQGAHLPPRRASANPASVPSSVASSADQAALCSVTTTELVIRSFAKADS